MEPTTFQSKASKHNVINPTVAIEHDQTADVLREMDRREGPSGDWPEVVRRVRTTEFLLNAMAPRNGES